MRRPIYSIEHTAYPRIVDKRLIANNRVILMVSILYLTLLYFYVVHVLLSPLGPIFFTTGLLRPLPVPNIKVAFFDQLIIIVLSITILQ